MKYKELNGRKMKKDLEADVVRRRYHNQHVDNSGNFGYTIRKGSMIYDLWGEYDKNGKISSLNFSDFAGRYYHIPLTDIALLEGYDKVIEKIKTTIDFLEASE